MIKVILYPCRTTPCIATIVSITSSPSHAVALLYVIVASCTLHSPFPPQIFQVAKEMLG